MSDVKKCVLAYSGGLDTSAIVVWLCEQGYEVHAVLVDVGQDEDLSALCHKALRYGAKTAVIRDAKPAMFDTIVPTVVGLSATYEGNYRLGTALARPFIALEQVKRANELGGATLVHGATGKGNDQIRFEYAYGALAPQYPVLAPWRVWDFEGRIDLINYLAEKGYEEKFVVEKDYSLDENLWHISVEGGVLEKPNACVDVPTVLKAVEDRFAQGGPKNAPQSVEITIENGIPKAVDGVIMPLQKIVALLNRNYRHASWAWDLIIENRMTGIKSRGLYINPAAKLLNTAMNALACSCLAKAAYDQYVELGQKYGNLLYNGQCFSDQSIMLEAAAKSIMSKLNGTIVVQLAPTPYAAQINATDAIFQESAATFEASDYTHADAAGFINLGWRSAIGKPFVETAHENTVEAAGDASSDVCTDQQHASGGLVATAV